jgi:hypothetical protein
MKRLIIIAIVGVLASQGCADYQPGSSSRNVSTAPQPSPTPVTQSSSTPARKRSPTPARQPQRASTAQYKCDGRQYCSQMTSCAEATYFLKNCPGVKMDGDNDGVPCESQWCN